MLIKGAPGHQASISGLYTNRISYIPQQMLYDFNENLIRKPISIYTFVLSDVSNCVTFPCYSRVISTILNY